MNPYEKSVVTVSQLNGLAKMMFESSEFFRNVYVKGEISNFVNHRSGHFYFSLKDEASLIKAVMFKFNAQKIAFIPENGLKVIVHGRISVFERDGVYQLYADDIQPDGLGSLYYAYEQLKRKLESEGLFDDGHKKPLPRLPMKIGIITSPTGAAIQDMKNILSRRFPLCRVLLYPALVQGVGAADELTQGIKYFNEENNVDLIIIGRGGGSIEDLWAFNDETLAREIYASTLPVISAVGHESDFTICDFVADVRASTPSAAAELAVPEASELYRQLGNVAVRLDTLIENAVRIRKSRLEMLSKAYALTSPAYFLDNRRFAISSYLDKLDRCAEKILGDKRLQYKEKAAKLNALNPLAVLSRGYSVIYGDDGKVLWNVSDVSVGDEIHAEVSDGIITSIVKSTEKKT